MAWSPCRRSSAALRRQQHCVLRARTRHERAGHERDAAYGAAGQQRRGALPEAGAGVEHRDAQLPQLTVALVHVFVLWAGPAY